MVHRRMGKRELNRKRPKKKKMPLRDVIFFFILLLEFDTKLFSSQEVLEIKSDLKTCKIPGFIYLHVLVLP